MRVFISLEAVVFGMVVVAMASPVTARAAPFKRQGGLGADVASIGSCPVSFLAHFERLTR
jgi:hypothetical protein